MLYYIILCYLILYFIIFIILYIHYIIYIYNIYLLYNWWYPSTPPQQFHPHPSLLCTQLTLLSLLATRRKRRAQLDAAAEPVAVQGNPWDQREGAEMSWGWAM